MTYADKYLTPIRCPHCTQVSVPQIVEGWNATNAEFFTIKRCTKCGEFYEESIFYQSTNEINS